MDRRSFIARQLRDLTLRSIFQPFTITLLDGTLVNVSYRQDVTFLSEGVLVTETGGTERVFPYAMICSLSTIFLLPLENPDSES